jgi:O-antigen/teichoic acid export membrane protein
MNLAQLKSRTARLLPKNTFARGVSVLAGGTAVSQLITIAVLPLLTRLYNPEDFSVLAVYSSILALITVISCLRFEIAIPMPQEKKQAKELLVLSLISVFLVTLLSWVLILLFSEQIHALTQDRLRGYLWLLPIGVLLSGIYTAFQYWSTRGKNFGLISKTRMTQAISGAGAQVGLGYIGLTPIGLLLGQLLNVGAGAWSLARSFCKKNIPLHKKINLTELKSTYREYDRFPKYSTLEALANSAAVQVPVLIIAAYALGPEAGFLMLAMRLLSAPMGLIGRAVAQVYLSEAPAHYQNGNLDSFTRQTIVSLVKLGGPPLLFAGVTAPVLVPIVFGSEWARAGVLVSWMAPWFFMQFISSSVSMSLHVTGNQKIALVLQLAGFVLRTGLVLLAGVIFSEYIVEVYALTGFVFYVIYMSVIFYILRKTAYEKVGERFL